MRVHARPGHHRDVVARTQAANRHGTSPGVWYWMVLGAAWVHTCVFDDASWARKGDAAKLKLNVWAEGHFQRRDAGRGGKHCLLVTWPVLKRTEAEGRDGAILDRLLWDKQGTREESPFRLGAWMIRRAGWGECHNGGDRTKTETGSDWGVWG